MEKAGGLSNRCLAVTVVFLVCYIVVFSAVAGYYGVKLLQRNDNLSTEVRFLKRRVNTLEHKVIKKNQSLNPSLQGVLSHALQVTRL